MHLHYQAYGAGEPLIILHGLFGSLSNWQSISLQLAQQFRILAVDQRNHGQSPHSEEMTYAAMAADLEELLDLERLPRANVMGHSMGGKTAMQFALRHPDRVEKLAVVDIAPRVYPPLHRGILEALRALRLERYQHRKQIEDALAPSIPDLALRQFLLKNLQRNEDGTTFSWRLGLEEIYHGYPSLQTAVLDGVPFTNPTLFIRGERSDFLRPEDLPSIRQLFPHAQLETVPRAGHLVHTENAAAFLAVVSRFLAGRGA